MARGMQKAISKERAAAKKANGPQQGRVSSARRGPRVEGALPHLQDALVDYFQLKQHYEQTPERVRPSPAVIGPATRMRDSVRTQHLTRQGDMIVVPENVFVP